MPTSTVEDQRGDGPDADAFADLGQMFVHGLDADSRHDQGGTVPRFAQMRISVPWLSDAGGMSQWFQSAKRSGMANGGFILKPDFNRPANKLLRDSGARQPGEVFVNTPPPQGGGFELRLKAGSIGPVGR